MSEEYKTSYLYQVLRGHFSPKLYSDEEVKPIYLAHLYMSTNGVGMPSHDYVKLVHKLTHNIMKGAHN